MHYWETPQTLPTVITIFSAPNYCDCYKNKAAVIKLEVRNGSLRSFLILGRELQHKEFRRSLAPLLLASRDESLLVLYALLSGQGS